MTRILNWNPVKEFYYVLKSVEKLELETCWCVNINAECLEVGIHLFIHVNVLISHTQEKMGESNRIIRANYINSHLT